MSQRDPAALIALLLLTLAWAWPLAAQLPTAMPGTKADPDVITMVWNVGWIQHALETDARLFRCEAVLLPFGADLRLHTFGVFLGMLVWPVAHWAGVVTAFNVGLIGTLWLNGCAGYLLFRDLPTRPAAALVAAGALMLSGPVLDQLRVGRPIFASIWITCAAIFVARRIVARPTLFWSASLGAVLIAALLTDFQILLFTGLWLALLAGWTIWRERGVDRRRAGGGLLALAMFAVPFLVIFYPALAGAPAAGIATPSPAEAVLYSLRWWDYLTPSVMPRALGGYEVPILVAAGLVISRRDVRLRFWLLGAGVFLLLALGPKLKFTEIPLPFSLLSVWPPLGQFRSPYRLTIPAMIGLAAVAALVLDRLFAPLSARTVPLVVVAALALRVGLATLQHPLVTQEYPAYDLYRRIAQEESRAALIEVPFGVRSGVDRIGTDGELLQYYQHVHQRPMINAMVARLPHAIFEFYRSRPSLLLLAGEPVGASDETVSRDLEEVIALTGAGYLLMHRDMMTPETVRRVEPLLDRHPALERFAVERDLVAYRIAPVTRERR